jgi:putative endonuclease
MWIPPFWVLSTFVPAHPARLCSFMHYVYVLESVVDTRRHYTGFTQNLRTRIAAHNAGQNPSTAHGRPWRLVCYFAFADQPRARDFEHYLKSGSGKTFAKRHFIQAVTMPSNVADDVRRRDVR